MNAKFFGYKPGFLDGMSRTLDVGCHFSALNLSKIHFDDVAASRSDWREVGNDLRRAIGELDGKFRHDPGGKKRW